MRESKRRKKYLVDRRLQLTVMLQLMAVMLGIAVLYTIGLTLHSGADASEVDAAAMRARMIKTSAIYFALATAILATLTIIVLQRVVGPVFVMDRAIKAMRRGDHNERLALRKRDHFKSTAAELSGLRDEIVEREQKVRDLQRCLEEGDIDAARELSKQLNGREPAPASAPEEVTTQG